jgi:hypothetical protein
VKTAAYEPSIDRGWRARGDTAQLHRRKQSLREEFTALKERFGQLSSDGKASACEECGEDLRETLPAVTNGVLRSTCICTRSDPAITMLSKCVRRGVNAGTKPRDFGDKRRIWGQSSSCRQHQEGIQPWNVQDSGASWCSSERLRALVHGRCSPDALHPAHGTGHPDTAAQRARYGVHDGPQPLRYARPTSGWGNRMARQDAAAGFLDDMMT